MEKHFTYKTTGVCASEINFDIIDGILHNIDIVGGCKGNSAGVERLSEGMAAADVVKRCKGIPCHGDHSCPDKLAKAIELCLEEMAREEGGSAQ